MCSVGCAVAEKLRAKQADLGIMICGSGVGGSIAVNKFPGVRGAVCHDVFSAHQGVEDDDMNVLCLGARVIGVAHAQDILTSFLGARFTGEARHQRRLDKVLAIGSGDGKPAKIGLPYGSLPRLLLAWLTTEAVKTKTRELTLGDTLSDFMRQLDLVPTGGRWGSITRLKDQTRRLFASTISAYCPSETPSWSVNRCFRGILEASLRI